MKATLFTVVFAFNLDLSYILLIQKRKPAWQRGLLNGIGGKVEDDETPEEASVREFYEECAVALDVGGTTEFARLATESYGVNARVYFYYTRITYITKLEWNTKEKGGWFRYDALTTLNVIPNLRWLIPMARLKLSDPLWIEKGHLIY